MVNDKTSNKDMALLMKKMRAGEVTTAANTQEMIGFLDDSDFENRIPRLLPKTVKVYHKIGNEIGNLHDVGIVDDPKHPYYIGIMTNDVTDEPTTEDSMAQISKLVYDFMTH
jgi:beta-lactamase class A